MIDPQLHQHKRFNEIETWQQKNGVLNKKINKKKSDHFVLAPILGVKFRVIFLNETGRCLIPHLKTLKSPLIGNFRSVGNQGYRATETTTSILQIDEPLSCLCNIIGKPDIRLKKHKCPRNLFLVKYNRQSKSSSSFSTQFFSAAALVTWLTFLYGSVLKSSSFISITICYLRMREVNLLITNVL